MIVRKGTDQDYINAVTLVTGILSNPTFGHVRTQFHDALTGNSKVEPKPEIVTMLKTFSDLLQNFQKENKAQGVVRTITGWQAALANRVRNLDNAVSDTIVGKLLTQTSRENIPTEETSRVKNFFTELEVLSSANGWKLSESELKDAAVTNLLSQVIRSKTLLPTEISMAIKSAQKSLAVTTTGTAQVKGNTEFVHMVEVLTASQTSNFYAYKQHCLNGATDLLTEKTLNDIFAIVLDVYKVDVDGQFKQIPSADFKFCSYLAWTMSPLGNNSAVKQTSLDYRTYKQQDIAGGRPIVFSLKTRKAKSVDLSSFKAAIEQGHDLLRRFVYLESDIELLNSAVLRIDASLAKETSLQSDRNFLRRGLEEYIAYVYLLYADWRSQINTMSSWMLDALNMDTEEKRYFLSFMTAYSAAQKKKNNTPVSNLQSVNRMVKRLGEYWDVLSDKMWADPLTISTMVPLMPNKLRVSNGMATLMGGETDQDILDASYWAVTEATGLDQRLLPNKGNIDVALHYWNQPEIVSVYGMIAELFKMPKLVDSLNQEPMTSLPLLYNHEKLSTNIPADQAMNVLFRRYPDYPSFRPFSELTDFKNLAMEPWSGGKVRRFARVKSDYSGLVYYNRSNSIAAANAMGMAYSIEATNFIVTTPLVTNAYYYADAFHGSNEFPNNIIEHPKDAYLFGGADAKILSRNALTNVAVNCVVDGIQASRSSYLMFARTGNDVPIKSTEVLPVQYSTYFGVSQYATVSELNDWLGKPFTIDAATKLTMLPFCLKRDPKSWFVDRFVPRLHVDQDGMLDLEYVENKDWHINGNNITVELVPLEPKAQFGDILPIFPWKMIVADTIFLTEVANLPLVYTLNNARFYTPETSMHNSDYEPSKWLETTDSLRP